MRIIIFDIIIIFSFVISGCSDMGDRIADSNHNPADTIMTFSADIQPIFNAKCATCHGGSGGLILSDYTSVMIGGNSGLAVIPFEPDSSLLVKRIEGIILPRMPSGRPALSATQISTLKSWINQGAPNN